MIRRLSITALAGLMLFGGFGCRLCNRRPLFDRDRDYAPSRTRDPGDGSFLREPVPSGSDRLIPAPGLPPRSGATDGLPPPVIPESSGSFRIDPANPPKRELLLPQGPAPVGGRDQRGLLGPPVTTGSDSESRKSQIADATNGVPGFAKVRNGLAAGRVPTAAGFAWLKKSGYRTAVYLHALGADTTGVRRDAEAEGLTFKAIAVSPEQFTSAARTFSETVNDRDARPTFVFDEDGIRSGSLWYWHFRTSEFAGDDTARLLAAPLGLQDPPGPDQNTFWVAIRKALADR